MQQSKNSHAHHYCPKPCGVLSAASLRVFCDAQSLGCVQCSAVYLQSLGFKAIASTSAGFAWTVGCEDNTVTRDQVLAYLRKLVAGVDIPVNADFEGSFAHDPEGVAANVTLAVEAGVAGLSIEDYTGDDANPLYAINHAVARIKATRAAIDATGADVLLTARTESMLFGKTELAPIIHRLQLFAEAGAGRLFAPVVRNPEDIRAVVASVSAMPVNIMGAYPELSIQTLASLGLRRISTGGALARSRLEQLHGHGHRTGREGHHHQLGAGYV